MFNSNYTYTLLPIIDSNICSQYPKYNYGKSKTLLLQNNEMNTSRILINFDKKYFPSQSLDKSKGQKAILTIYNRYQDSSVRLPTIDMEIKDIPCLWTQGHGSVSGENGNVSWDYPKDNQNNWDGNSSSSILLLHNIDNQGINQMLVTKYDIHIDITDVINSAIADPSSQFYGIMIKLSNSIQADKDNNLSLSYYSRQTYTVYKPNIIFYKNNFRQFIPTSPQETLLYNQRVYADDLTKLNISLRGFKKLYSNEDIIKFNLCILQRYRQKSFNQNFKQIENRIVQQMYFSLVDDATDQTLIDFGDTTRVSYNLDGNYFLFNMKAITQKNRYYRFVFRVVLDDGQSLLIDNKQQTFKVQ